MTKTIVFTMVMVKPNNTFQDISHTMDFLTPWSHTVLYDKAKRTVTAEKQNVFEGSKN